jgi:hypothetical protein
MNAKVFSAALVLSLGLVVAIEAADAPGAEARGNNAGNAQTNNELQFNGANLDANAARQNRDRSAARELLSVNVGSFAPFASNGYDNFDTFGYGYHHSSTAGGDYLRGGAQVISATGQAVKNLSEAMVNAQVARDLSIDNNYKYAETYWKGRRMWKDERNYERGQPLSTDQLVQISRAAAPERLTPRELNPNNNDINWPAALRRPEFDTLRALVQAKFDGRTVSNTGIGSETEAAVTRLAKAMQAELQAQLPTMTTNEYIVAKSFLRSLPYETRFMPAIEGLASR